MENLELWNKVCEVPENARKPISAGRLKGMTDINPVWRIKVLTENFGLCGIGWKTELINKEIIEGANGEKIAIVDIKLYIKQNGEWSEGIEGTGGSKFISKESNGYYNSDECFKMAYTDAISVACKSLGIGATIYWQGNTGSKYDAFTNNTPTADLPKMNNNITENKNINNDKTISEAQAKRLYALANGNTELAKTILKLYGYESSKDIKVKDYEEICNKLQGK